MFHNHRHHPLFDLKNDNYFAIVWSAAEGILTVSVIDCETEKLIPNNTYYTTDCTGFINNISFIFKNKFKAVIVCLSDFRTPQFATNFVFCQFIRAKLIQINMPHLFINDESLMLTNLLISSNISQKVDDQIITVILGEQNNLAIAKLKYTLNGYEKSTALLTSEMQDKNVEKFRQQIIGNENHKKIILYSARPGLPFFKMLRTSVLKSKKLIAIEQSFEEFLEKSATEFFKWLNDKCYTRFYIIPTCIKRFTITDKPDNFDNILCIVNPGESLPVTKEFFVKESTNIYVYDKCDETTSHLLFSLELEWNSEDYKKFIFTVDAEGFPKCDIQEFSDVNTVLNTLPTVLDKLPIKIPIILFFKNYSFIFIKENDEYKFCQTWNELNEQINIELNQEKLSITKMKTSESSILFAVKDLIKIMAMPSNEEMIADERWDFKFIKNAEDSLLLEFEISEGIKRAAPPSFLMAYLLKKQIKAIKKETSVRPSNIAFWAIDKYSEEEKKRIYLQLQEACNTLSNTSAKYKCECEFVLFKM